MDSKVDTGPTEALDAQLLRAQMRIGSTLRGKWRLDVLLGIGGMATVYAATHRNGSRAAVKILYPELSLNTQLRGRFLREGYVANSVGHEGAVKVIDDDTAEDGSLFLVTELLDGETLEDRRVRFGGQLPEHEVLFVVEQVLDVLAAAHAKGIVHRDLKPENIFLTRDGRVKLLDFGIARLRELTSPSTATRQGATLGTPAYMAPEQALGLWDEVESRSDLWACGATMFHLLSGRRVHEGRTPNEQLLSAMTKSASPFLYVWPSAGSAIAAIVDRALAFDREQRWPDARSMQQAVQSVYLLRHGAGIGTAPRLTVPPQVVDRTSPLLGRFATDRPVESLSRTPAEGRPYRPLGAALTIVAAAAVGAAATGAAWVVSLKRASPTSSSSANRASMALTASAATAQDAATRLLPLDEGTAVASDEIQALRDAGGDRVVPSEAPAKIQPVESKPAPTNQAKPAPAASPAGYKNEVPY